jgi:hypothetical protein
MAAEDDVVLNIVLNDTSVASSLQSVSRKTKKHWSDLAKQSNLYNKRLKEMSKPSLMKKMIGGVKDLAKEYKSFGDEMGRLQSRINQSYKSMGTAGAKEQKALKARIALLKSEQKMTASKEGAKGFVGKARVLGHKASTGIKNAGKDSSVKEIGKMSGAAIVGAFAAGSALMRKDLAGAFESGVKTMGKGWKAAFASAGKVASHTAGRAGNYLQKKGEEKGGAGGGAMKALGGIMKSVGPILNIVSKLGPMIEMAAASVAAIVKLFIDAEAQAKEINKTILETQGAAQFLSKGFQSANIALDDMSSTLAELRNEATKETGFGKSDWLINKDEFSGVIAGLGAEGVSVKALKKDFTEAGEAAETSGAHAKSFSGAVQVAVGYSRLFGVSLAEITSFTAEMMKDLGQSLAETQLSLHQMNAAASEAGMAQNKFMAIIRGTSSDLNGYNARMEDSIKLLGLLGKVMNPRNAARFHSQFVKGFQGKDSTELVKINAMSGWAGGAANKKDLAMKAAGTAKQIGGGVSGDDILAKGKDGKYLKSISELLEHVAPEKKGALRESLIEHRTDQDMNGKGVFGQSMAMENLSPGAAFALRKKAVGLGKGGKMSDKAGEIGAVKLNEMLGGNLKADIKMEAALEDQKQTLLKNAKTDAERAKVNAMDDGDLFNSMSEPDQDQFKASKTELEVAKETGAYTKTVMDRIGQLVDFVMNQLYNVMTSIWDTLVDMWDTMTVGNKEGKARAKLEVTNAKTKNKEMIDLLANSTTVDDFRHKAMGSTGAKDMEASLYGAKAGSQDADPKKRDASAAKYNAAMHSIDDQVGGKGLLRNETRTSALKSASGAAGVSLSGEQMMKAQNAIFGGKDMSQAMTEAGVSEDDQAKILDKIRMELSPEQLALAIGNYQNKIGTAQTGTAAPGPAPDGSAAPGTPAAPMAGATGGPAPPPNAAAAVAIAKQEPPVTTSQGDDTLSALDSIQTILFQKGIKINKSFLLNPFWTNGHDAVLEATREALFEYFMYSKLSQDAVAQGMQSGTFTTAKDFVSQVMDGAKKGTVAVPTSPKGGAEGGTIMKPRSPDSVFAAVQPGETIVPKGGSAGGAPQVSVAINGPGGAELAEMMRSAAINVVQQWQRKQKFT